ncbi:hypothetical protein KP509_06G054600 [Ceratopteris richardii]|uniref:HMA domain-containing protein n=1 Tax=Ceratopteris richardii TaxID=49495 RepID=A0A8T2UNU3_CERRI|nr:hypothetical protein KP509_06G054600 [Ceratopteris richardii]
MDRAMQLHYVRNSSSQSSSVSTALATRIFYSTSSSNPLPSPYSSSHSPHALAHIISRWSPLLSTAYLPQATICSIFRSSFPFVSSPLIRCPKHGQIMSTACISISAFASVTGGGGIGSSGGPGGGGGGGQGGGGDGSTADVVETNSLTSDSNDFSVSTSGDDIIQLNVGGMSCGGCAASVKKILEAQPNVVNASVDLASETAVVKVSIDPELLQGSAKLEIGEALAKQLSSCGFTSTVKGLMLQ